MFKFISPLKNIRLILGLALLLLTLSIPINKVFAKTPPEMRNQEEIVLSSDMHGKDLRGYEFVKRDLRGVDMSETDLRGAVFNNSQLQGSNLTGADMEDIVAFASIFEGSDLSNANLTNALLMESSFLDVRINGTDFTNAVINRIQQKQLCEIAEGTNPITGISTSYSLGC